MTLIREIKYKEGVKIALWQISDSISSEKQGKNRALQMHKNREVQQKIVRSCLAGWDIQNTVFYDLYGKPHLENSKIGISISHSFHLLALGINLKGKIGLDLEKTERPFEKLAHRFVNDREKEDWDKLERPELAKIWSAKESLYKMYGRKRLDFRKNLEVIPGKNLYQLNGTIDKNGIEKGLHIYLEEVIRPFILTWVIYNGK